MLAAIVLCAVPVAGQAAGQPTPEQLDAARALAEAGFQLYEQGDYATALDRFTEAEEIYHAPPHVLYIARASAKVGKLVEARKAYEQLAGEDLGANAPEQFREAQQTARGELEPLRSRIPSLVINVTGISIDSAIVTIDGQGVPPKALGGPVEVNPGEHELVLRAEGREPTRQSVTIEEGTQSSIELAAGALSESGESSSGPGPSLPPAADEAEPSIVPPIIVGGVGVALIGVGAITGVMTLNDAAELKDRCPQNPCPPENESLGDEIETLSTISTVTFIVGGAAVAAGVLWLVLQGGGDSSTTDDTVARPDVRLVVGGPYVGLEGTF